MQMTHYDTISFRPHPVQFVINELPLMSVFLAVVVYGAWKTCRSAVWRQSCPHLSF